MHHHPPPLKNAYGKNRGKGRIILLNSGWFWAFEIVRPSHFCKIWEDFDRDVPGGLGTFPAKNTENILAAKSAKKSSTLSF